MAVLNRNNYSRQNLYNTSNILIIRRNKLKQSLMKFINRRASFYVEKSSTCALRNAEGQDLNRAAPKKSMKRI